MNHKLFKDQRLLRNIGGIKLGKHVLVIEDEPNVIKLVKFILESESFKVSSAFVGAEGIEKAKELKPDLIILDIMLPHMDGFEVASILSKDDRTNKIPILILSSKAQFEDKRKGIEAGAADYLTKPFDQKDLLKKIDELIQ